MTIAFCKMADIELLLNIALWQCFVIKIQFDDVYENSASLFANAKKGAADFITQPKTLEMITKLVY